MRSRACAAPRTRSTTASSTRTRSCRSRSSTRKGETQVDIDEAAGQGPSRQDPAAEARLRQGRHDHRGDLSSISDGAAALVLTRAERRDEAGQAADRAHRRHTPRMRRSRRSSPSAPVGAIQKVLDKAGWNVARRRPVRGQRGVRLRRHVRDAGPRHPARQDQRQRRRDRARSPDRRQRRAHHRPR